MSESLHPFNVRGNHAADTMRKFTPDADLFIDDGTARENARLAWHVGWRWGLLTGFAATLLGIMLSRVFQ